MAIVAPLKKKNEIEKTADLPAAAELKRFSIGVSKLRHGCFFYAYITSVHTVY